MANTTQNPVITLQHFHHLLSEKVSVLNAKMLVHTAALRAGVDLELEKPLPSEAARALCMELIRLGGPSFHVGKSVYQTLQ